jgi:CDGSH-type Zn-finger protein/uncharacterized Fe-S cluster protein YjdI
MDALAEAPTRERLLHFLYEAAELEHNLMCTYLYAAFSLRSGVAEGLSPSEADTVQRWRRTIIDVAIDEMSHLTAIWNITSSVGGIPRVGRTNFPLDPGWLPARVIVRLEPFSAAVLQHFIHLERPAASNEPDGGGFAPERNFRRSTPWIRLVPLPLDYDTVGEFYRNLSDGLRAMSAKLGDTGVFIGDPTLQLSSAEVDLPGARRVTCLKTAISAFESIVLQGEGAPENSENSHFARFSAIRAEYSALQAHNPAFTPAHPAATNPVLREPPRPGGRVWLEDKAAIATVDLANAAYELMVRLLAYAYVVPAPHPDKALAVDLSIGLMQAVTGLGERAARLPAGPSHPDCNAGMSFTTLRDTAPLPFGPGGRRFFIERLDELSGLAALLPDADERTQKSSRILAALATTARHRFDLAAATAAASPMAITPNVVAAPTAASGAEPTTVVDGVQYVEGKAMTLVFEGKRCIHSRMCVTGAPDVFLANVKGPWIHPDAMDAEQLVAVAHACPSGAIRYRRKDGRPDEPAPLVNLASVRESGPYAVRGMLQLDGVDAGYRVTLCRCGASSHKPFCDGSHKHIGFNATGEPPTGKTDTLPVRNGVLAIDPQVDGPLKVRGNLEITSGTGRVVARVTSALLCRCGASANKPFCDSSHLHIGFKS